MSARDQPHLEAAIFDLDGVITDTARLHAGAWKELIDRYLEERAGRRNEPFEPFDKEDDYRRYVDGKPRYQGLASFLESRDIELPWGDADDGPDQETVCGLGNRKDAIFARVLEREGVELIDGTVELVDRLREAGVRVAVASSSRNCGPILERAGIADRFEARVDGETVMQTDLEGKPAPDIFVEAARRVGADPPHSVVFEDAVSGVEAALRGDFGLVVGVVADPAGRVSLREAGAHLVWEQERMGELEPRLLNAWLASREHRRPGALAHWDELAARLREARPVVFLDYDGTLTPIVSRPDEAVLSGEMREAVRRVARRFPTTVVSGRGREDVSTLVDLPELNYAGSHGFDISGPKSEGDLKHEAAAEVEPVIEEVTRRLKRELAEVEGTVVEPKRFTVAVHYRLVDERQVEAVESAVESAVEAHDELQLAHGKKVFEIRPALDWDKGKAVLWILEALELDGPDTLPLYLGDDTTDEDAFQALEDRGLGFVVFVEPRPTAAGYQLQDVTEVREFLDRLADL